MNYIITRKRDHLGKLYHRIRLADGSPLTDQDMVSWYRDTVGHDPEEKGSALHELIQEYLLARFEEEGEREAET